MKVFISWSGNLSKNIAEIFRQWIPGVIQAVKPYYSPDDITKGTRWSSEISKELDTSRVGIICLTSDSINSPWIMFEAGALSKNIDKSKVCPILFDIEPSDIQGPLVQFQAAKFSKKEVKRVMKMINAELGDKALATDIFDSVFDMWWPKLEEKINTELSTPKIIKEDLRSERDLLEEILRLTREIGLNQSKMKAKELEFSFPPHLLEEILYTLNTLSSRVAELGSPDLFEYIERLFMLFEDLVISCCSDTPKDFFIEMRHRMRYIQEEFRTISHNNFEIKQKTTKEVR